MAEQDQITHFTIARETVTSNGIRVFLLPVVPNVVNIDTGIIPENQYKDIERYRVKHDRDKRLIARSFLYHYLRSYYGVTRFDTIPGDYKKPLLHSAPGIHFSISYSGNYILTGISSGGPLGVDIERIDAGIAVADMAASIMCAEEVHHFSQLTAGSPEQRHFFFSVFSIKEAIIKAFGTGLYYDVVKLNTLAGGLYNYSGENYEHSNFFEEEKEYCINICWKKVQA